ncbi:hypothetical protein JW935_19195 [candidate division KSB1 bacterium]|nr:hypothetical protein [candidate division KSB1 bacterium]
MQRNVKGLQIFTGISCLFLSVCFIFMGNNIIEYADVYKWVEKPEIYGMLVFIGLMIIFFCHFIFLSVIIWAITMVKELRGLSIVTLIAGTVSFISLLGHWGCLTDVVKETPLGYEINRELVTIWISTVLIFLFFILLAVLFVRILSLSKNRRIAGTTQFAENLFISLNLIGFICGCIGLLVIVVEFFGTVTPINRKWIVLPTLMMVILPYIFVLLSWVFCTLMNRSDGWRDEKISRDLTRAGITTWIVSIPVMVIFFMINFDNILGPVCILWLPFYIFTSLVVFSVSSLYYYKLV